MNTDSKAQVRPDAWLAIDRETREAAEQRARELEAQIALLQKQQIECWRDDTDRIAEIRASLQAAERLNDCHMDAIASLSSDMVDMEDRALWVRVAAESLLGLLARGGKPGSVQFKRRIENLRAALVAARPLGRAKSRTRSPRPLATRCT